MHEPSDATQGVRDRPWIFRTYAGHSTARESNALYRRNLAKGQTGLSVAFDLPTQKHKLKTGEKCETWNNRLETYDIACSGPRVIMSRGTPDQKSRLAMWRDCRDPISQMSAPSSLPRG